MKTYKTWALAFCLTGSIIMTQTAMARVDLNDERYNQHSLAAGENGVYSHLIPTPAEFLSSLLGRNLYLRLLHSDKYLTLEGVLANAWHKWRNYD